MLSGYQTYMQVDSWGLVFKKEPTGKYQGYLMLTRNKKAVMMPCDDDIYLCLHKAIEKSAEAFKKMENSESNVYKSTGFES